MCLILRLEKAGSSFLSSAGMWVRCELWQSNQIREQHTPKDEGAGMLICEAYKEA